MPCDSTYVQSIFKGWFVGTKPGMGKFSAHFDGWMHDRCHARRGLEVRRSAGHLIHSILLGLIEALTRKRGQSNPLLGHQALTLAVLTFGLSGWAGLV